MNLEPGQIWEWKLPWGHEVHILILVEQYEPLSSDVVATWRAYHFLQNEFDDWNFTVDNMQHWTRLA